MKQEDKLKLIRDIIFLIMCAIGLYILGSCAPQKRLNRLLDRHPELTETDTVIIHDTLPIEVPGARIDSNVALDDVRRDTLVIREEQLTVKAFHYNDSIYISGECDTIRDTIIRAIRTPTEKIVYRRPRDALSWYHYLFFGFGIVIFWLLLVVVTVKTIRKS